MCARPGSVMKKGQLSAIRSWQKKELSGSDCHPDVFYPFSGPDIMHAATLFPDARSYVMIGLEPVGKIPEPGTNNPAGEVASMHTLHQAVSTVLGLNFFKTLEMENQIGRNQYSGVGAIMLFFMSSLNFEILDAFYITANAQGQLVKEIEEPLTKGTRFQAEHPGVVFFVKTPGSSEVKKVVYLSVNIADYRVINEGNFQKFMNTIGPNTTMMKAASYLLYRSSFDDLRGTILGQSDCILTDSSGMPYHYLSRPDQWKLQFYGTYLGAISLFAERFQPDLFLAMEKNPEVRPLPFKYSYAIQEHGSHLILAKRKDGFARFRPEFDEEKEIGQNTRWDGHHFIKQETWPAGRFRPGQKKKLRIGKHKLPPKKLPTASAPESKRSL